MSLGRLETDLAPALDDVLAGAAFFVLSTALFGAAMTTGTSPAAAVTGAGKAAGRWEAMLAMREGSGSFWSATTGT